MDAGPKGRGSPPKHGFQPGIEISSPEPKEATTSRSSQLAAVRSKKAAVQTKPRSQENRASRLLDQASSESISTKVQNTKPPKLHNESARTPENASSVSKLSITSGLEKTSTAPQLTAAESQNDLTTSRSQGSIQSTGATLSTSPDVSPSRDGHL